jgi:hypothetical protein
MHILVPGDHVGMPVSQWCEIIEDLGRNLLVRSLGDPNVIWQINPEKIKGVKLSEKLRIRFAVTQISREMVSVDTRKSDA